jgi:hypothetical protein
MKNKILIIFPCDYYDNKAVEADYKNEYDEVVRISEFDMLLFNYDKFIEESVLNVYPSKLADNEYNACIYRGWMFKPDKYANLYKKLKAIGLPLINSPEEYNNLHLFPNIYGSIKNYTPKTLWHEKPEEVDVNAVNATFKRFFIKDYVKSVKGEDFPILFETPVNINEIQNRISQFIEMRSTLYTGGIVFKEYVDLKRYGSHTNEYRAFYLNGEVVTVSANSNQPKGSNFVPEGFVEQFKDLTSNFYTVDFAETDNDAWIVLETGDGQVSGLSPKQYVFKYYDEIRRIIYA